ncbi:Uncharacterised protein [Shigella flexneri]|nr:Uncharacterised protein [Shigella flexneri]
MPSALRTIFSAISRRAASEALNVVVRFCCACRAIEGNESTIADQRSPSMAREIAHAMTTAPATARSDLWVGLDASATSSIKESTSRAGSKQPNGETRIAAPLVTPLFSSSATGLPSRMALSAIFEVGPSTFLLKASKRNAQSRILRPIRFGSILPSHSSNASARHRPSRYRR